MTFDDFEVNELFDESLSSEEKGNEVQGEVFHPSEHVTRLSGMYREWFLDYASYVILERAVPHVLDGLKPVQRRILHAMWTLDDGRFTKVANIIGHTMQYHPHGDASIGEALVQLGQKELLIETQGNWGNIFTGDNAAAPRYIEARLSKFALEVAFNPKITKWKLSYDGRKKEPVVLPMKFPILLVQGVEGIAVGLASKILPHNFNEIIESAIAFLEGRDFKLYPDFPTGGLIDVSKYNDGLRGGLVKVRARINKIDKKTLVITEIPYGKTTGSIIESIIKANEKGKIKIKKIDDNTAENVEIVLHLTNDVSADKTIDALYAFTDCEITISPNSCVIDDKKPNFFSISEILKLSVLNTKNLLQKELEIRLKELEDSLHYVTLEKIFIENELYEPIKQCKTEEEILLTIRKELEPYKDQIIREITNEDLIRLSNIPIKRISKYSSFEADENIKRIELEIQEIKTNIKNIIPYTIKYFKKIKEKYGKDKQRKTEIRNFENIEVTNIAIANQKLYVNRTEGFIGTSLKKDEYVCDCSDVDDVIVIKENGKYLVTKVSEKQFVGKDILYVGIFRKNDTRTIYNIVYRDGNSSIAYIKRCNITGIMRDKEYDLTQGKEGSKILYISVNPNGESEKIKVILRPRPRIKNLSFEVDFAQIDIKGRNAKGNILTKNAIHKIVLLEKGESTLGGTKVWFDNNVLRLNYEGRGVYLGEFFDNDKIIVFTKSGYFRTCNFDISNHFETDILLIEKFKNDKIYTAIYFDGETNYYYLKRFTTEVSEKPVLFISEHQDSKVVCLSATYDAYFECDVMTNRNMYKKLLLRATDFIGVKSYKARGKRISDNKVKNIIEIIPQQNDLTEINISDNNVDLLNQDGKKDIEIDDNND